ncbi:MAG: hypothetical protein AB8H86_30275 [Polyangiales bacterium]
MKTTYACLLLVACGASQAPAPTPDPPQSAQEEWALERGARPSGQSEEFLAPGGSFVREFQLGDGCHLFFVVVAPGVRDADLALWSPEGELLVTDEAPDARPTVQLCGARRVFARVNAPAGAGAATLHHFRSAEALELNNLGEGAATYTPQSRGELASALATRGYREVREWTFELNSEEPTEVGLGDEEGCFTLVAQDASVRAQVVSDVGEAVRGAGDPAMLQWCAATQTHHRVRLEGEGSVRMRLYRATEERAGGTPGLWLGDRSHSVH